MKNLLISNDDGVQSPGLWALKEHFKRDYRVFMVAPDRERSATSHSISLHDPIRLKVVEEGSVYALDGTPVDAVHVALLGLVENHVDCVLTGVNIGLNLGTDVFYSGTVSAAIHAASFGIPSIAVSIDNEGETIHYETAAHFAHKVLNKIETFSHDRSIIINLNVPNLKVGDVKGVSVTRLGKRCYKDKLIERRDPKNNRYYWIDGAHDYDVLDEGTDVKAVHDGKVSVTPLHVDITAADYIDTLLAWELDSP